MKSISPRVLAMFLKVGLMTVGAVFWGAAFSQGVGGRVQEVLPLGGGGAFEDRDGDGEVDGDFFTENLDPHGTWVEVADHGICWRPSGVDEGWRPYSDGYWAYTDSGWTWVSYEPFGSIVYHYGRWLKMVDGGWVWVPGREWGPAWVSWRHGDDYVGWAPLPPAARWRQDVGISVWVDTHAGIGPSHYQFCSVREFGAARLSTVIFASDRNPVFLQMTQNVTNISYYNRRPFCGGPGYDWLAARCQRPVPRLRLVCEDRVDRIRERAYVEGRQDGFRAGLYAAQQGDVLVVPAPRSVSVVSLPTRVGRPKERVELVRVDHGWHGVQDAERRRLEVSMARQTQGLTPAVSPARRPGVDELRSAPKPVGVKEREVVLTKGGGKPVALHGMSSRSGEHPEGGVAQGKVVPQRSGLQKMPLDGSRLEVEDGLKKKADAFAEMRRSEANGSKPIVGGGIKTSGQGLTPEASRPIGIGLGRQSGSSVRESEDKEVKGPMKGGVSPTKSAVSGLKEQDRRADEMRRDADQFARGKAAPVVGNESRMATEKALGGVKPVSPSGVAVPKVGVPNKTAQTLFDQQKRDQQRLADQQAARERSVKAQGASVSMPSSAVTRPSAPVSSPSVNRSASQTAPSTKPVAVNGGRPTQPSAPVSAGRISPKPQSAPASVPNVGVARPSGPSVAAPNPVMVRPQGGLAPALGGGVPVGTGASGLKKKEDEKKK
jgi:hypothetical protein